MWFVNWLCKDMQFGLSAIPACSIFLFPLLSAFYWCWKAYVVENISTDSVRVMVPGGYHSQDCYGYKHASPSLNHFSQAHNLLVHFNISCFVPS